MGDIEFKTEIGQNNERHRDDRREKKRVAYRERVTEPERGKNLYYSQVV